MSDTRSTVELIEAILNQTQMLRLARPEEHRLIKIEEAIVELRRRGDSLVRADDVRRFLDYDFVDFARLDEDPAHPGLASPELRPTLDRLDAALAGGVQR